MPRWILSLTLIALLPLGAWAEQPLEERTDWMAMLLNGSKTGYMKLDRLVYPDRVVNRESLVIELNRGDTPLEIRMQDESVETRDGWPVAFASRQQISGGEITIQGRVSPDGEVSVTSETAGSVQTQTFQWTDGALMAEGLRILTLEKGLEPGTEFEARAFIPSSLQSYDVVVRIGEPEVVDLFGVEQKLFRVEQEMDLGGVPTTSLAWMDGEHNVRKLSMEIMGMAMEVIACPRECAVSPAEPTEFFTASFAQAPRRLDREDLNTTLRYEVVPIDGDSEIHFPESDEQSVREMSDGAGFEVVISPVDGPAPAEASPVSEEYLAQTRWLQIDATPIQQLSAQARGDISDPYEVMLKLQNFVRDYVSDKTLSVGYASALEVANNRSGDCTEHALLLAALGRAAGIPTRVATGLAYVERWLGAEYVFVPHAWTQAWIKGRWISFDAALGRFDTGHIALGYGDGDPWRFYEGVNTLGNFEIRAVEAVAD